MWPVADQGTRRFDQVNRGPRAGPVGNIFRQICNSESLRIARFFARWRAEYEKYLQRDQGALIRAMYTEPLRVYLLGTFLGIIPGSLVYASVGNGLGAFFEVGEAADIGNAIYQPEVLLPIVALVVLSLLPVAYKKVRSRHRGPNRGGHGEP